MSDTAEKMTKRLLLWLQPSLWTAIEEWSWEHRIRSRSEAVRQLIKLGLAASVESDGNESGESENG